MNFKTFFLLTLVIASASALTVMDEPVFAADPVEEPITLDLPVPEEPVEEPTSLVLPAPDNIPEPCESVVPIVKVPHHHYNIRKFCISAPVRVHTRASACTKMMPLTKCFNFKIKVPEVTLCSRPLPLIKPTCVPKIPLCQPLLKAPVLCGRSLPKFASKSSTFTSTTNNPLQSCAKASASASTSATY